MSHRQNFLPNQDTAHAGKILWKHRRNTMAITHFTFEAEPLAAFVRFGYDLYHEDTSWIPPLQKQVYAQLSPDSPFFQKPGNCHRNFLIKARNKVIGRISAMVNQDLKDQEGIPLGTIGFFECVNDPSVAQDLLSYSTQWLRQEKGIHRIWGPMNFDIWHSYRLMTKGFDQKLFYGEPYNKAYYRDFFEENDFIAKYYWDSVEITEPETIAKMVLPYAERYRFLVKRGYHFKRFNMKKFKRELRKLHFVLTRSFNGFLGFTPIALSEFMQLFEKSRYAFHPQLFTFIYDEHNVLAGFSAALLELSDAIRAMNGKDNLRAKLKFIYNRRRVNRINFYITGITPEEAKKKTGSGRAGYYYIMHQILKEGFETLLLALMAKGNRAHKMLGEDAPKPQREYALYELNL